MTVTSISNSAGQLRALVERIESLEEEKAEVAARVREIYAEAKAGGFDATALRALVRERRLSPDERAERDALLTLYRDALAGLAETPLGAAAVREAAADAAQAARAKRSRSSKADAEKTVADAVRRLGAPSPLTDEERARGVQAAVVGRDGTRMSLAVGGAQP